MRKPTEIGWPPDRWSLTAFLTLAIVLGACGGEDPASGPNPDPTPQTGLIQVSTATAGVDLDPDGYSAAMDGNAGQSIGLNGVITFTDVATGQHQVELTGLAANCAVTGANPSAVTVSAGMTAQAAFAVTCVATSGSIQVSTATTGGDLDPDGYGAAMDGNAGRSIGLNGVITFTHVAEGPHQVLLVGLAANCAVSGANPKTVTVTAGTTAQVSFAVACQGLPRGSLDLTATTSNNFDPDGFLVQIDGVTVDTLPVNGTVTIDSVTAGSRQLELTGVAPNCVIQGQNPRTVSVPDGGMASEAYTVTCTSPPDGRIIFAVLSLPDLRLDVMNADGTGQFTLYDGTEDCCQDVVWSRDGSKIAVVLWDQTGTTQIHVMNKDGSQLTQLTDFGMAAAAPAWSPDGSQIAFDLIPGCCAGPPAQIFVMNADGSGLTQLTSDPTLQSFGPSWSPDGSKIVFGKGPPNGQGDRSIYLMNADGTNIVALTGPNPICSGGFNQGLSEWTDGEPQWSPDGSRIAFVRKNNCEMYGGPVNPDPLSPQGAYDILLMDPDGSNMVNLTSSHGGGWEINPRWSPDGSRIMFHNGGREGFVMNADGSGRTQLPTVVLDGRVMDWGP